MKKVTPRRGCRTKKSRPNSNEPNVQECEPELRPTLLATTSLAARASAAPKATASASSAPTWVPLAPTAAYIPPPHPQQQIAPHPQQLLAPHPQQLLAPHPQQLPPHSKQLLAPHPQQLFPPLDNNTLVAINSLVQTLQCMVNPPSANVLSR